MDEDIKALITGGEWKTEIESDSRETHACIRIYKGAGKIQISG